MKLEKQSNIMIIYIELSLQQEVIKQTVSFPLVASMCLWDKKFYRRSSFFLQAT
jgi:hypothetical protein